MMTDETRTPSDCRVVADDAKRLSGHAILFNSLSVDLGGFREQIHPDAVDRTLAQGLDVRALVDHETSKVLGRTRAGTLTLRKDSRGLKVLIEPDLAISYAADIMRSVSRGDVSGMSFRFRTIEDEWNYDGPLPLRTVTDMTISEVSIVTFPAYEKTDIEVALRSLQRYVEETRRTSIALRRKLHRTRLAR